MSYAGTPSTQVTRDLVQMFTDQWVVAIFGKLPSNISVTYDKTVLGNVGARVQEAILVYCSSEKFKPFDLGASVQNIDWKKNVSIIINIYTNISEKRFVQLVDAVQAILQKNHTITSRVKVDGTNEAIYRKLTTGLMKNLSEFGRKNYRYVIDLDVEVISRNDRNF